ncbi:hypothetical protein KDA_22520 [Dictyobacter alpinus]|uniref:AB hydrolase-1 domain-containing protein n=1 Tax=Dictyobacter alpinus TaxID=2014873 RepID=A0A402B5Z1_9CHLR|nr:alpha/beta hydrolase [Dictyobacter alpinus]GCE26768.1 hypothetical protein KDA_22520 [Dictyobacter alpinus]
MEEKGIDAPTPSFITLDDTKIYYEVVGKGQPIVFLYDSQLLDYRIWDGPFQHFAQSYQVLRFDPRGCGKSQASATAFSRSKDLFLLLQQLHMLPVTIIDLSARPALDFIHAYPDSVASLVLISPEVGMYKSFVEAMAKLPALLNDVVPIVKELKKGDIKRGCELCLEKMVITPSTVSPEVYQWMFDMVHAHIHLLMDPQEKGIKNPEKLTKQKQWLKDIRIPTLLLEGEFPTPTIQKTASIFEQEIPQLQKRIVPNSHVMLHLENPQGFANVVLTFLAEALL